MLQHFCYLPTQRERILLFSSLLKDIFKGNFHREKESLKQRLSQCAQFFGNNLKITSGFWKKTLIKYFIRTWIGRKALHFKYSLHRESFMANHKQNMRVQTCISSMFTFCYQLLFLPFHFILGPVFFHFLWDICPFLT